MTMTPGGWGVNVGGYRTRIPVNEYGEVGGEEIWNPSSILVDMRSKMRQDNLESGLFGMPDIPESAYKQINQVMNMSKESKRARGALKDMSRKMDLKKMRGEQITEQDMKAMWAAKDAVFDIQMKTSNFYKRDLRHNEINKAINPKRFSSKYGGTSKQLKRGRK